MATDDAMRRHVGRLLDLGVTQVALADRLGILRPRLNRWLSGERPNPLDVHVLDRLHDYLDEAASVIAAAQAALPRAPAVDAAHTGADLATREVPNGPSEYRRLTTAGGKLSDDVRQVTKSQSVVGPERPPVARPAPRHPRAAPTRPTARNRKRRP